MALTATTLNGAITASQLTFAVTSGTGFPTTGNVQSSPGLLCRVDKEFFWAIAQPVANTITVRGRGSEGTFASAHGTLAKIEVAATPQDFANAAAGDDLVLPQYLPQYSTLGVDTTFTTAQVTGWGNHPQMISIVKATACLITLVAPTKGQDGLEVTFTSLTDAIHVITATSLYASGGASSPYTTATWANAKAGGGITLVAENALWNVVSSTNVTLT